jgi:hypothetical protein
VEIMEKASVIADPHLRDGYAYWCRKAACGRLPRRSEIDPVDIPHLLPHVRLVDVVEGGRFRYRLVGAEIREQHAENPTGRYLDEVLSPPVGPHVLGLYRECVETRRPLYVELELNLPSRRRRFSRILYLPLAEDGVTVTQVFCLHMLVTPFPSRPDEFDLWAQPYRELVHAPL